MGMPGARHIQRGGGAQQPVRGMLLPHRAALAVVLLCGLASAASPAGPGLVAGVSGAPKKKYSIKPEDIVIAYPADDRHIVVAKASRIWRKGVMRTFIANNHPPSQEIIDDGKLHNETWSHYPDDNPRRSLYPGDSRAGLVPFLAHKHFGDTYKWLLYMDDDTIFFPDAVMRLLEDFDPDMPYFISDHLWWPDPTNPGMSNHPNKEAPRCLPCHFDETPYVNVTPPFPAPKGCPCTPQLLCDTTAAHNLSYFNQWCDMPRAPITVYSMHGGAGGILSIGLMRKVSFDWMERCTKSLYSTGGDAFISICLWQAGYAITDPGLGLYHPELQYFDPGPEDRVGAMLKLSQYIDNTATKQCNSTCELQLEHMVSLHVRSRMFNTLDDAASFIRGVSIMYEVYADIRRSKLAAAEAAAAAAAASDKAKADATAAAAKAGAAGAGAGARGGGVKKEEAVQATAAAAAAAVAAATTAAAQGVGPDGRPLSQSEQKQKELAASLAEDAIAHQDDHRNATAIKEERERQQAAQAAAAVESQAQLRAAAAAAVPAAQQQQQQQGAGVGEAAAGAVTAPGSAGSGAGTALASGGGAGAGAGAGQPAAAAGGGGVSLSRRLSKL